MRLQYLLNGWSSWIIRRVSSSPKILSKLPSVLLNASNALEIYNSRKYNAVSKLELKSPGLPRCYIIGLSGLEMNRKIISGVGIVVRNVIEQHVFSYSWVSDRYHQSVGGKGGNQVEETLNEKKHEGVEASKTKILSDDSSISPNAHEATNYKLVVDQLAKLVRCNYEYGEKMTSKKKKISDDDGFGVIAFEPWRDSNSMEVFTCNENEVLLATTSFHNTSSSRQYFDVLRMRSIELLDCQARAEAFARRLWKSLELRNDEQLSKLTSLNILTSLTRWLFNAISKRLVYKKTTELDGLDLLNEANKFRVKCEILTFQARKAYESCLESLANENLIQCDVSIREQKYSNVITLYKDACRLVHKGSSLLRNAEDMEWISKTLVPRMELSIVSCRNYQLKLQSARIKDSLGDTIYSSSLKALIEGTDSTIGLSNATMENIRLAIAKKRDISKSNKDSSTSLLPRDFMTNIGIHKDISIGIESELQEQMSMLSIPRINFSKRESHNLSRKTNKTKKQSIRDKELKSPSRFPMIVNPKDEVKLLYQDTIRHDQETSNVSIPIFRRKFIIHKD